MNAIALDTETTGANFLGGVDTPFVLYGCDFNGHKIKWEWEYDPVQRRAIPNRLIAKDIREYTEQYDQLVFHNGKFDIRALESIGVKLNWRGKFEDTMIMSHVLDNIGSHGLKDLAKYYLLRKNDEQVVLKEAVKKARSIARRDFPEWRLGAENKGGKDGDTTLLAVDYWILKAIAKELKYPKSHPWWTLCDKYGFGDVIRTIELYYTFSNGIEIENLSVPYRREIELLEDSLYEMEGEGINVIPRNLKKSLRDYRGIREKLEDTLLSISPANWKSGKELPLLLFGEPKKIEDENGKEVVAVKVGKHVIPSTQLNKNQNFKPIFSSRKGSFGVCPIKLTKSKLNYSTDKYALKELLELKMAAKPKQYLNTLMDWKDVEKAIQQLETIEAHLRHDFRVHTNYKQTGTKTTRVSASDPNTQQISKGKEFENEEGEKATKYKIREVFGPTNGRVWYAIDYSQLQLRIFAYIANERGFIESLEAGYDAHAYVASRIYEKSIEEITAHERRIAKNCYHPDTEVLTVKGWKKIGDVEKTDLVAQAVPSNKGRKKVKVEWVHPTKLFRHKNESGKLIHFKNEGIDLRVTPDHRMLSWDQESNINRKKCDDIHSVYPAKELPLSRCWSNAGVSEGDWDVNEFDLRLAVAIQADGSITDSRYIRFGFTKKSKIIRLENLLNVAGIPYSKKLVGKKYPYTNFVIKEKDSSRIKRILKLLNKDKTFKWKMLQMTFNCREIFLDEIRFWDAALTESKCTQTRYYSTIKKNIDIVQAIASITNRKTRSSTQETCHTLSVKLKPDTKGGNVEKTEIDYDGDVVCLSVPSTFLLVRDKGIPVVSGNCNFGFIFGASPERIEETAGVKGLWDTVLKLFPSAHSFMRETKREIRNKGYVTTPFGYRLWLPYGEYGKRAEHAGVNYMVQGCEGDIVKNAMIKVSRYLRSNRFKKESKLEVGDVKLIFQVHDELVFDFPKEVRGKLNHRRALRSITKLMEEAGKELGMLTPVDIDVHNKNWDAKVKNHPYSTKL